MPRCSKSSISSRMKSAAFGTQRITPNSLTDAGPQTLREHTFYEGVRNEVVRNH